MRLLNIKLSESKYVFDLLSIQLFMGIANSFINIVSFTFFIHHFSVSSISYAYLVIACVLLLLNLGYEKLEKKLSPLHLLRAVIVISAIVLLFLWTGLLMWDKNTMIFLLLVWGTLFYMLTGYAYWGIASLLFNIRESKRVFAIVGSGDIPAKLIGYVSAPLLIPIMGLENLLLLSVISLGVGFVLLTRLIHKKRWEGIGRKLHSVNHHSHPHAHKPSGALFSFFFKHKLIFTISVLSLLSYNVFNLIDYTFVTQIKARVQDLSILATYIAIFFAAGRLVTLIFKLIFSSRVIERMGIIYCLLITPIALAIFCVLFELFFDGGNYTLYIFGLMAMFTEVLRSAMQEPVFFILFQPLNEHQRLKGHIIAKGYMLAPSLFIVGASLLIAQEIGFQVTIGFTVFALIFNLAIWVAIIFYIKKAYAKALHSSIARGVFSGEGFDIYDEAAIEILLKKLHAGSTAETLYALKLLESGNYSQINELLQKQLQSANAEVKLYALDRLEERGALTMVMLEDLVNVESDDTVKEKAITALCKLDTKFLEQISKNLAALDDSVRKQIIIILLGHREFNFLHVGSNEIKVLMHSPQAKDRELALEIIGSISNMEFTQAIELLMADEDSSVKRNAMITACKLQNKTLLPFVLDRLKNGSEKFLALQALFQYGDKLFEDIVSLPAENTVSIKPELIKIAAKIKGAASTQYLLSLAQEKEVDLADRIIDVLWLKGYKAEGAEYTQRFEALLDLYLKRGAEKVVCHATVPHCKDHDLIKNAIANEIWYDLTTCLKLCAILHAHKEISRVIELAENRDRHKLFNAMEMLEMFLPKKTARAINNVFDYLLEPVVKKQVAEQNTEAFMRHVIITEGKSYNHWTKALCMFSSLHNKQYALIKELGRVHYNDENSILTETRTYVVNSAQQPLYVNH